jgi:hypothetical protein
MQALLFDCRLAALPIFVNPPPLTAAALPLLAQVFGGTGAFTNGLEQTLRLFTTELLGCRLPGSIRRRGRRRRCLIRLLLLGGLSRL